MNFTNVSKYFLIIQPFPLFLFIILNLSSRIRPCFRLLFRRHVRQCQRKADGYTLKIK